MSRSSHFFEGFCFGALLGGILALLFAPASGVETRKKISQVKDENEDIIKEGKEKTEVLIAKTLEAIDHGFEKINTILEDKKVDSVNEASA